MLDNRIFPYKRRQKLVNFWNASKKGAQNFKSSLDSFEFLRQAVYKEWSTIDDKFLCR